MLPTISRDLATTADWDQARSHFREAGFIDWEQRSRDWIVGQLVLARQRQIPAAFWTLLRAEQALEITVTTETPMAPTDPPTVVVAAANAFVAFTALFPAIFALEIQEGPHA